MSEIIQRKTRQRYRAVSQTDIGGGGVSIGTICKSGKTVLKDKIEQYTNDKNWLYECYNATKWTNWFVVVIYAALFAGFWILFVYLGMRTFDGWVSNAPVPNVIFNKLVAATQFMYAFAFAANINKFLNTRTRWVKTISAMRDMLLFASTGVTFKGNGPLQDAFEDMADACIEIMIEIKHKAVVHRKRDSALFVYISAMCPAAFGVDSDKADESARLTNLRRTIRQKMNILLPNLPLPVTDKYVSSTFSSSIDTQQDLCALHIPSNVSLCLNMMLGAVVFASGGMHPDDWVAAFMESLASGAIVAIPYLVSEVSVTAPFHLQPFPKQQKRNIFFIGIDYYLEELLYSLPSYVNQTAHYELGSSNQIETAAIESDNATLSEEPTEEADSTSSMFPKATRQPFSINL